MRLLTPEALLGDPWRALADAEPAPPAGAVIVPLARLVADGAALAARGAPLGLRIDAGEEIAAAAPFLAALDLVVIRFPKFRDGRGFTTARSLRERFGFAGEIRADGALIPDQAMFLWRCGVDAVVLPDGGDVSHWQQALQTQTIAYQPGRRPDGPLRGLKRRIGA